MKDGRGISLLVAVCIGISACSLVRLADGSLTKLSTVSALESLPVNRLDKDEPAEERRARLMGYAKAIDAAAPSPSGRALLISVGYHESGFAKKVCDGNIVADKGRAFGCWQSWERDRSGGVAGQAKRAISHLHKVGNWCVARGHERIRGAVSVYATGNTCEWAGAEKRIRTYKRIVWRLKNE